MHVPERVDHYWLEALAYNESSMDGIATEFFGRKYVGQQTDGCLPRGILKLDMSNEDECLDWENKEAISE